MYKIINLKISHFTFFGSCMHNVLWDIHTISPVLHKLCKLVLVSRPFSQWGVWLDAITWYCHILTAEPHFNSETENTQSISTLLVQQFICKNWQMSSGPLGPMFISLVQQFQVMMSITKKIPVNRRLHEKYFIKSLNIPWLLHRHSGWCTSGSVSTLCTWWERVRQTYYTLCRRDQLVPYTYTTRSVQETISTRAATYRRTIG